MTKQEKIEKYLSEHWEFRYNVLTGKIEFRGKEEAVFKNQSDYHMYSILREIDKNLGETISAQKYKSIVLSDYSPQFHPIKFYFNTHLEGLGNAKGFENIKRLADTVKVENPDVWFLSLKKWLAASVAQGLNDKGCQNHTCIVMTGGMGLFKTTWLMNLCPPMLYPDYAFTGKIDLSPQNKDVQTMLSTKFIINLDDQLRNLIKKDGETMKTIITQSEVTVRRPYAQFDETLPRMANFLASLNGDQFIGENENRRFLPFRILSIDIRHAKTIDMNMVWNEARTWYNQGLPYYIAGEAGDEEAKEIFDKNYRYWWTDSELKEAFPDMESFAYSTDELEMITTYFDIPETKEQANVTMNATEIASFLKLRTNGLIPSTKKIGESLVKLKAINASVKVSGVSVKKYFLIERDKVHVPDHLMPPAKQWSQAELVLSPKMN